MARALVLWSLLSVVSFELVTSAGQYQKIPENYLKQTGNDSQLVSIQFMIYRPCQPEDQREGVHQDLHPGQLIVQSEGQGGQSEGQGLCPVMTNPCSLQINRTITELFFTNETSNNSDESNDTKYSDDESYSYWTLLDFSPYNNSLKLLPVSKFIPDIILKGAFIFDLQCMTKMAEILPEAKSNVKSPSIDPLSDGNLSKKYWIIIVGILSAISLGLACLIVYNCRRGRHKLDKLPSTYCTPTRSRKTDKEMWNLNSQHDNGNEGMRFQSAEQLTRNRKSERSSWYKKIISKSDKRKNHNHVNTENMETMDQEDGREQFSVPVNSHDHSLSIENYDNDYLPMDGQLKKSSTVDKHTQEILDTQF